PSVVRGEPDGDAARAICEVAGADLRRSTADHRRVFAHYRNRDKKCPVPGSHSPHEKPLEWAGPFTISATIGGNPRSDCGCGPPREVDLCTNGVSQFWPEWVASRARSQPRRHGG